MNRTWMPWAITTAAIILSSAIASAADTTETFDVGVSDFELYLGGDGIGLAKYEKTIYVESLLGFGFTPSFSGYFFLAAEANERLANGGGGAGFGIFGTPLDTDHFDVDFFLGSGFGDGEMHIVPALELNLDARPDLALCGLYFRAEVSLAGEEKSVEDDSATPNVDETSTRYYLYPVTGFTVGGYLTLGEIHQLLVEYDMAFHHRADIFTEDDVHAVDFGSVALGYNVAVSSGWELISQVSVDIPKKGESASAGIMAGFVATLP